MHDLPRSLFVASALAVLCSVTGLRGQSCIHLPDSDPTTGAVSTHPFGEDDPANLPAANQALVWRIPTASLPAQPVVIRALAFASAGDRVRHFDSLSIRLGQTTNPGLNTILSLNMQGFTARVMAIGQWQWTTPADQFTPIGLTEGYRYDPQYGDLVIELAVAGATSTGSGPLGFRSDPSIPSVLQTAWRFAPGRGTIGTGAPKTKVCWDLADLQTFGGGCPGSNGLTPRLTLTGSARIGQRVQVALRDVAPTAPGTIMLFDPRLRGAPLDIAGFGAPGCVINTFFTFNAILPLQAGRLDLSLPIPNDQSLVGVPFWTQFLPVDPAANALGLVASNFGRVLVGS